MFPGTKSETMKKSCNPLIDSCEMKWQLVISKLRIEYSELQWGKGLESRSNNNRCSHQRWCQCCLVFKLVLFHLLVKALCAVLWDKNSSSETWSKTRQARSQLSMSMGSGSLLSKQNGLAHSQMVCRTVS